VGRRILSALLILSRALNSHRNRKSGFMERDFKCFSGNPAVEAERPVPLKAGFERVSASFGFAAKRDVAGSKKIYERE